MKTTNLFIPVILSALVLSCKWEVPKTVSVKTDASYNFSIGTIKDSDRDSTTLADKLSVQTVQELLPKNGSLKLTAYDYNPGAKQKSQQFLIDFPIVQESFNIAEKIGDLDFADKMKKMSFEQSVKVPELSAASFDERIPFSDVNSSLRDSFSLSIQPIKLPQGINGSMPGEISQAITVTSPEFSELEFSEGFLFINAVTEDEPLRTDIVVKLCKNDGSIITSASNVDLSVQENIILPLAGKCLYPEMKIVVSGSSYGGTVGSWSTYNLSSGFSDDIKIRRAKGLTMSLAPVGINRDLTVSTDPSFVSCTIKTGSLSVSAALPDTWNGITSTANLELKNGIVADDSDFDKTGEGGIKLINRKLDLAGKTFTGGGITVNGTVNVKFENADITFPYGSDDSFVISANCAVETVESITVDLAKKSDVNLKINESTPISGIPDYIKEVVFLNSGLRLKYINGLPEGNDPIKLKAKSDFFSITETEKSLEPCAETKTVELLGDVGESGKTVDFRNPAAVPPVDFSAEFVLPGSTAENPGYVTLKNIDMSKEYKIEITVEPVINWKSVTVDTSTFSYSGSFDTGLNLTEIFGGLTDALGDSSDFVKNIELSKIPLYLYTVIPTKIASSLNDISGYLIAKGDKAEDYIEILGTKNGDGSMSAARIDSIIEELPLLVLDSDKKIVLNSLDDDKKADGSGMFLRTDIANLFNSHPNGNITMDYSFGLGSSGEFKIENDTSFEGLQNMDELTVEMHARLVLPLELKVIKYTDAGGIVHDGINVNLNKIIGLESGGDLFGRSESSNFSDIEKYIEVIEKAGISYKVDNSIIKNVDGECPYMQIIMPAVSGKKYDAESFRIDLGYGDIGITGNDVNIMLSKAGYPFAPVVSFSVPAGTYYIPRGLSAAVSLNLYLKTDGTIELAF